MDTRTLRLIACALTGATTAASAQGQALRSAEIGDIRYDVTYNASTAERNLLHVQMAFSVQGRDSVVLSLPAWTPGSYEIDNFARFVAGFSATGADGREVAWNKIDFDTWVVRPTAAGTIHVNFDFTSDTLDTGMAWMAPDVAFFNGTNVFLYPEGRGFDFPARVAIHTEPEWRVATGMTPAAAGGGYTATNYHDLVDMPTMIGRFDFDSSAVAGTEYRLATYPAGILDGATRDTTWDEIRKMMPPMAAVFGEVPYPTYTILMVFDSTFPGGSALEHQNSHLGIYASQFIGTPILPSITAHETFHSWNVKRLRPAEMVPYQYDRAMPTPLLWVSEGITDYYADLALVRGGIVSAEAFYQTTAGKMNNVANTSPVSLEDASLSTWIGPTDGTFFIYYPKGSVVGFLLDILIRDASDNHASLDDVMRDLYQRTFKHERGFTTFEWWLAVGRATHQRSFEDFYSRYIRGRDPLPYAEVLPRAGLRLRTDTLHVPRIGISTGSAEGGVAVTSVSPGSSASDAGLAVGDVLVSVGDVTVEDQTFGNAFRQRYADTPEGSDIPIVVRRGAETVTLPARLRFATQVNATLEESPEASPKAVRIRNGILTGTVEK